ncbi:MAG: enoyl-CoA hydratase-related protein [Ignavibacteriales bacterium]|nr:enoyl-CoA hydratase-related protein [Ignavibacteriales bacterium]
MPSSTIISTPHDGFIILQLHRPEARNAINLQLIKDLMEGIEAAEKDDAIRCIVLTGDEKAFAAGADIREMASASAIEMLLRDQFVLFDRIRRITKPIIAAVAGYALGGGCELALMCDIILAADSAKFGQPEVSIGVIPGWGGTQRLTHAVGKSKSMEMILGCEPMTADEALRCGLVSRVVPAASLLPEAEAFAAKIAAKPPLAIRLAKESINQSFEMPLEAGLALERKNFYLLFASDDQKEGMNAFIEKRKAEWKGK